MRGTSRARRLSDERGYLMVALIVAMSVMAIMMGAALPAWHTKMRREKEAELVFRGEQYARAIGLYQRKFPNVPVPSIDELVEQRLLRKKYKDPITNDEFAEVKPGTALPGEQSLPTSSGGRQTQGSAAARAGADARALQSRLSSTQARMGGASAGIVGVTSKSTEKSLRLYNGRGAYNEWIFIPVQQSARAGGPAGARGGPAGARGAGDGRGVPGRGTPQTNPGRGGFESRPILPGRGTSPSPAGRGGGRGPATPPQGGAGR